MKPPRASGNGIGWLWLALGAAYLAAPVWMRGVEPARYAAALADTDQAREQRNASGAARLFGRFRVAASDVLFVKTEQYFHGGVDYAPHLRLASLSAGEDAEHALGPCGYAETIIPPPEKDWRGFVGALEREVNPWLHPDSPHKHAASKELLPFYWLAVRANPHNTRAYRIGVFWLTNLKTEAALGEALAFADEGLRNNPDCFALDKTRGVVLLRMGKLKEALVAFERAARAGLRQRPREGVASERWDEDLEEELESALRYGVLTMEQLGLYREALDRIEFSHKVFATGSTLGHTKERILKKLAGQPSGEPGGEPAELSGIVEREIRAAGDEHDHEHEHEQGEHGREQDHEQGRDGNDHEDHDRSGDHALSPR